MCLPSQQTDMEDQYLLEGLDSISRVLEGALEPDLLDSTTLRMELLYSHLIRIHDVGQCPSIVTDEVLDCARRLCQCLCLIRDETENDYAGYQAPLQASSHCGRPSYIVGRGQLVYFIEHGFTAQQMSNMLGVSLSTIRRRMNEYGLSIQQTYSTINNDELNHLVRQCLSAFPNAGYRMVGGWLRQNGYRVQETRVRQSLREVDPVGIANRWLHCIRRRVYNVSSSQALWHLDGNHKLIR